jgi:hypothetical protein
MERSDFSYNYNANGYMIQYKGKNIGGAGVMLPRRKPLRGKQSMSNCKYFQEQAELAISNLIANNGKYGHFKLEE